MSNEALDLFEESSEDEDKFFENGGQVDETTEQVQDQGEADGQATSQEVTPQEAPQDNTVPHSRFHAEMMERQRAEQEAANLRAQNAQLMQLKQQLDELRKGKATEEETSQFEEDPLGYMKNKVDTIEQQRQLEQRQSIQIMQQQQAVEQINTWATAQVSAFTREHEDYGDAFNFVLENRRNELVKNAEILGIQVDPAMIENQLQQESMGLIVQAAQANKNPAEIVYNLAIAKGYTKAQAQQMAEGDETLKQKLNKIEKGQAASSSLAGTTSAPEGELSVSDVSNMNDEEFDAFWDKFEREARGH